MNNEENTANEIILDNHEGYLNDDRRTLYWYLYIPMSWNLTTFRHAGEDIQGCNTDESGLTILPTINQEDENASDSSSGDNIEIDDKVLSPAEVENLNTSDTSEESHSAQCTCSNCDEIQNRFAECYICLEPLQNNGPCMCPWCGGLWCFRCTRRISRCAWCRGNLRTPAPPCLALQRLVNFLMLPCRNFRRGCTEMLTSDTRVSHEENCKFDTYMCPILSSCCTIPFEEIANHLAYSHNIVSVYSQKIKIFVENFQTKLKKTACCKTKYKIILLHDKSAFILKVCIYNYHVRVEIMRKRLGYVAETRIPKKSDYCAVIEFHGKTMSSKHMVVIENECYSKKAEIQWTEVALKAESDESVSIHVNISKTDTDINNGIANLRVS